jgi:beta-lactam-binding protein with PASTA domain
MVVLRALAKNPDDRYQSADEMEADLERVARGASVAAATVDTATQVLRRPPPAAADAATSATMIAPPPSTRAASAPPPLVEEEEEYREGGGQDRPLWPWLVAIAFVVAAAIAGFFVWHELSGSSKVQEPVSSYVNEPQAAAKRQIRAAHLVPVVKHQPNKDVKQGIVFKQSPKPGSHVDKGGSVTIWVSSGPPKVDVPDVKGLQWAKAQAKLANAGLKPVQHVVGGNDTGVVTATDPPAGKSVPEGTKVRVNVERGPGQATVPTVVGLSLADAIAALHSKGLNANPTIVSSDAPQNQVIHQDPAPGTAATKGSTVNLTVSNGPPKVSVPTVVGETAQQAVGMLQGAGFQVTQQFVSVSDASQDGIVQSQNPDGGTQATKGSIVTIVIGQHSPAGPPAPPGTTTTTTTTP